MNTLSRHPGDTVTTVSKQISFILLPGFALTSFALAIEALSVANGLDDQPIYSYEICSLTDDKHPGKVISSNGVPVEVSKGLEACDNAEMVFICAYKGAATIEDPQLLSQLRRLSQKGVRIVALSGGSFVLAKAGLLQDKGCTLVHEHRSTFAELYPSIPLQDSIYTVNGNVLTSAGGTATLDMLLYLIGLDQGKTFAHNVAQRFQQERIRSGEEVLASQRMLALSMKSPAWEPPSN